MHAMELTDFLHAFQQILNRTALHAGGDWCLTAAEEEAELCL